MGDSGNASSVLGPTASARVNKRDMSFELSSGRIMSGPPALCDKWICHEQLADILAVGDVTAHLYTADDEKGLRLARVDYLTARRREREGSFAIGSHVRYGKHGVFRIAAVDSEADVYVLESEDRTLRVTRARLVQDGRVVPATPAQPKPYQADLSKYAKSNNADTDGSIEIDDDDLERIVGAAVSRWLEQHKGEIIEALANHSAAGGKDHSVQ